jgi:xylose dehydrogenase (NAD/NADP)
LPGNPVAGGIRKAGGELCTIASSSTARAEEFASEFKIPLALDNYADLIKQPEIDAVYIPLAKGLHYQWALECARTGKHCLVEKPMGLSLEEVGELIDVFQHRGCRLVEAFMWRHAPQVKWLEQSIRQGDIGELRRIDSEYSFMFDHENDSRWLESQGGGTRWDLGTYCINASRMFFMDEPESVSACSARVKKSGGVDTSTIGWLDFSHERLAGSSCSYNSTGAQSLKITGTRGQLLIERPFAGLFTQSKALLHTADGTIEYRFEPVDAYELMIQHFTWAVRDPAMALTPGENGRAQVRGVMESLQRSARESGRLVNITC